MYLSIYIYIYIYICLSFFHCISVSPFSFFTLDRGRAVEILKMARPSLWAERTRLLQEPGVEALCSGGEDSDVGSAAKAWVDKYIAKEIKIEELYRQLKFLHGSKMQSMPAYKHFSLEAFCTHVPHALLSKHNTGYLHMANCGLVSIHSPLFWLSERALYQMLQWDKLLLNRSYQDRWYPVAAAVDYGMGDVLDILVDKGADLRQTQKGAQSCLYIAASRLDLACVKKLVRLGMDANSRDALGRSALLAAALNQDVEMIEFLVGEGADPNLAANDGLSPILAAVQAGHKNLLALLLRLSPHAVRYARSEDGQTLTHLLARLGLTELMEVALASGASAHAADKNGRTPLFAALQYYQVGAGKEDAKQQIAVVAKIFKQLIADGASLQRRDHAGDTPLLAACKARQWPLVQTLVETFKISLDTREGLDARAGADDIHLDLTSASDGSAFDEAESEPSSSPLIEAVTQGQEGVVKWMLEGDKNAALEACNSAQLTALAQACIVGQWGIARKLLDAGADPNCPVPSLGDIVLVRMLFAGQYDLAQLVLDKGAPENADLLTVRLGGDDPHGPSLLNLLASDNNGHAAALGLMKGLSADDLNESYEFFDADGAGPFERSPMQMLATQRSCLNLVQNLLALKLCDVDFIGPEGSALSLAVAADDLAMASVLLDAGAGPNVAVKGLTALWTAVLKKSEQMVELLLSKGANVRVWDSVSQVTLVWKTLQSDNLSITRRVLSKLSVGEVNAQDQRGRTLLMLACHMNSYQLVGLLLEVGALPLMKEESGKTAASFTNDPMIKSLLAKASDAPQSPTEANGSTVARTAPAAATPQGGCCVIM
jgi:ankyrin repeat protein